MSRSDTLTLGAHFEGFITAEVESGRYATASDVIRDALRLLEQRNQKREALVQALIEGEESGPPVEVTKELWDDIKKRGRDRLGAQ